MEKWNGLNSAREYTIARDKELSKKKRRLRVSGNNNDNILKGIFGFVPTQEELENLYNYEPGAILLLAHICDEELFFKNKNKNYDELLNTVDKSSQQWRNAKKGGKK